MKKLQSILLYTILISPLASCNPDDLLDNEKKTLGVVINDSSVYIQESFIKSFEQIWIPETRWKISYDHKMKNGKIHKSFLNYSTLGRFGKNIFEFTHNYDSLGIITSSSTNVEFNKISEESTFEYTYNKDGFISNLRKVVNSQYTGVTFKYNELGQLIDYFDANYNNGHFVFEYTPDGEILSYDRDFYIQLAEDTVIHNVSYTYTDGNMTKFTAFLSWPQGFYDEAPLIYNYSYDSLNRITMDETYATYYIEYEYLDSTIRWNYFQRYKNTSYLQRISTYTIDHIELQSIYLYNDYQINAFKYATSETGNKKLYYESINEHPQRLSDLALIGYSENYNSNEEIYDYNDSLLFYKEESIWYDSNNKEVSTEEITTSISWVKYVSNSLK